MFRFIYSNLGDKYYMVIDGYDVVLAVVQKPHNTWGLSEVRADLDSRAVAAILEKLYQLNYDDDEIPF